MKIWIKIKTQSIVFRVVDNWKPSSIKPIDILAMGAAKAPNNATTKMHLRMLI
jgi:hypothetical protein